MSSAAAASGGPAAGGSAISRAGSSSGGGPPGRWAYVRAPGSDPADVDRLAEYIAGVLLDRYGVVFRDLVVRESFGVPWREVLRALRRMEARGVVRGGRFVSGFVGEQYALPEAVEGLRRTRRDPLRGERIRIGATDPLNLTGVVLPGPRVPSIPGRSIELVDGALAETPGPQIADGSPGDSRDYRPRRVAQAAGERYRVRVGSWSWARR